MSQEDEQQQKPDDAPQVSQEEQREEPETFDREYVSKLRNEAASTRTKLREAEEQLKTIADKDKSDQEKANERAQSAEKRAEAAEQKLMRAEAASEAGLPAKYAARLTGSTKEELLADAKELAADFGGRPTSTPKIERGPQGSSSSNPDGMDGLIRRSARS